MFWEERMTFSNLIHQVIVKLLHLAVQLLLWWLQPSQPWGQVGKNIEVYTNKVYSDLRDDVFISFKPHLFSTPTKVRFKYCVRFFSLGDKSTTEKSPFYFPFQMIF